MPRDLDYVRDMLLAARKIQVFTSGLTMAQFVNDERTHLAVIRLLEIIGEAAGKVSASYRNTHPEVPWRAATDTRNRLIHGYREVRLSIVWRTVTEDIPTLIAQLEPLVPPEE